ncbi:shikimate kinase [Alteribacillus persepolensis]|uniref:Shikimate kinase n=1 Tax=Alteribacillus persepolensis TaxID=568899 RepID=A0A1G8B018_9BACI|nr:shikimate kinase [Alteribacillus persepolensis]SDH26612.1 shikimate kinase [Alteribacillus persepolensis]
MENIPSLRERNIALVGFMGVGKSTIGERLSKKLYRDFIDIDQTIEETYGMAIPDIFQEKGEKEFRRIEKDISIDYCKNKRLKILSLGGGAYAQDDIREACMKYCIVISLHLTWDSWKDRLNLIIDSRPVLHNKSMEEIEELFQKRQSTYDVNSFQVTTDQMDADEVADEIVRLLKFGWDLYQPLAVE